jgi:hypothetical protein
MILVRRLQTAIESGQEAAEQKARETEDGARQTVSTSPTLEMARSGNA